MASSAPESRRAGEGGREPGSYGALFGWGSFLFGGNARCKRRVLPTNPSGPSGADGWSECFCSLLLKTRVARLLLCWQACPGIPQKPRAAYKRWWPARFGSCHPNFTDARVCFSPEPRSARCLLLRERAGAVGLRYRRGGCSFPSEEKGVGEGVRGKASGFREPNSMLVFAKGFVSFVTRLFADDRRLYRLCFPGHRRWYSEV